jgi:hypothetical protein
MEFLPRFCPPWHRLGCSGLFARVAISMATRSASVGGVVLALLLQFGRSADLGALSPLDSELNGHADGWNASKWDLVLLTEAAKTGAVCLDGSPGGYYIRRGMPQNKRWVIFFEGGGWCTDEQSCAGRAKGHLGSSTTWNQTVLMPDWYEGSQLYASPPFNNATLVYAKYCDGGSWAGDATAPAITASGKIYYRGRRLLDALYSHLLNDAGLASASEHLVAGCSAGGLTVYIHADYLASLMPPAVKTVALADAMFAIDTPRYCDPDSPAPCKPNLYADRMTWVFTAMNW